MKELLKRAVDAIKRWWRDLGQKRSGQSQQQVFRRHHGAPSISGGYIEELFGLLKRERVNKRRYRTRAEARQDVFDYIERFYNRRRPHRSAGRMSPLKYEQVTLIETVH